MNITDKSNTAAIIDKQTPDQQELVIMLNSWLTDAENSTAESTWRTESEEDYDFYAGKQDDDSVKDALEDANRPVSVFNETKPKVDMLVGMADQIRRVPSVLPVGSEDEPLAELMNGTFKHFRYLEDVGDREMDCFEHTAKSGRSFLYFYMNMENPFEPRIRAKRLPGRDVIIDPDWIEYDLDDARFVFVQKWFTERDIKAYWPEFDGSIVRAMQDSATVDMPTFFDEAKEKFRLIEAWYRKWEKVFWFENPLTGQPDMLREPQWRRFTRQLRDGIPLPDGGELQMDIPPVAQETMKRFMQQAVFSGHVLLESGPSQYRHDNYPLTQFGAYRDETNNRWFGVITALKDPQRALNTMKRQLQHLLQTSPKGILVHAEGAITNEDEYDKRSSQPNFRLVVDENKFDKWQFSQQPQIPQVYQYLIGDYSESMKHISAAEDSLMGIQTASREPGVTQRMRMESSVAVLFLLFNNFRKSRILAGKTFMSMIQQYVTMPRVIRIEGEKGMQLVEINSQINPQSQGFNDVTSGKFDMVIDEEAENVTMRRQIAQMLLEFSHNNPEAIPPDIIMEYMDLPFSTKQRVKEWNEMMLKREEEMAAKGQNSTST